jgi:dihydroorotate dehydrogenase
MKHIGFGFNSVGTVTAKPYAGNPGVKFDRLIKSQSLLINKGFKSGGAIAVSKRLDKKNLKGHTIGISVGNSNLPYIRTRSATL